MFICAVIILPVIFATQTNDQWISVLLIGLAAGGHQAWSANIFTLVSDVFPKKATASVVGIGGMIGAAASIIAFFVLGHILDNSTKTGFFFAFLIAGSMYLICLLIVHLIMPKMTPLDDNLNHITGPAGADPGAVKV
jgi:ACS family hexuronate transporter-like MFS transporter